MNNILQKLSWLCKTSLANGPVFELKFVCALNLMTPNEHIEFCLRANVATFACIRTAATATYRYTLCGLFLIRCRLLLVAGDIFLTKIKIS